jgi:hypothetical protein
MKKSPSTLLFTLLILALPGISLPALAQNEDSLALAELSAELDALFANEADSLSLMALVDSLLKADSPQSYLSFRVGYSSRVTSAGRTFGIDQQALLPGISYYHSSGLYADATGIWNSELSPQYFLTIFTAGYLGSLSDKWSYNLSYDYSLYHASSDEYSFPITHAANGSLTLTLPNLYTGADYSYSFGEESAHSITWNTSGVFRKKAFKPFEKVTFLPTLSLLFGTHNITEQYNASGSRPRLANLTNADILRIAQKRKLSRQQVERLVQKRNEARDQTTRTSTHFGLMNYYISLPIMLSTRKFNFTISYNYNIPKAVEGVDYNTESNGYFGCSLTYNLGF